MERCGFAGVAWMHAGMRGYPRIKFSLNALALEGFIPNRDEGAG